jgi:hypothetical protein
MPRFYFDVHQRSASHLDEAGVDFPNEAAAESAAARAGSEIARDLLSHGDVQEVCIRVRDEHRSPLAAVTVTVSVRRAQRRD